MVTIGQIFFFLSATMIIYAYVGYYVVLKFLAHLSRQKKFTKVDIDRHPHVSFLIAVYNEEKNILKKLQNIFSSDYPSEKISVYVVSDASTDRTHEIVSSFKGKSVHLIVSQSRRGKTYCENLGLKKIDSDFIIFTDASTILDKHCIYNLLRHFAFKEIGCVSTKDESIDVEGNKGENLYVKYEMAIRSLETKLDSLIGLSGSCYAARRELCEKLPDYVTRDFVLPLVAKQKGFVSIDDPEAVCFVKPTEDHTSEFRRKIRTFTNGISTLFYKCQLLNILRYGKFSFMLWSHKVFRWLLPYFFMGLYISNVVLYNMNSFYKICLILQTTYYILAILGRKATSDKFLSKVCRVFYFVLMTNVASLLAWYNILKGEKFSKWEPTER